MNPHPKFAHLHIRISAHQYINPIFACYNDLKIALAQLLTLQRYINYNMLNFINKLFGSKSDRDVKGIMPLVEQIKAEYAKLDQLTNDELRAKTIDFKETIKQGLAEIDSELSTVKEQHELFEMEWLELNEELENIIL